MREILTILNSAADEVVLHRPLQLDGVNAARF